MRLRAALARLVAACRAARPLTPRVLAMLYGLYGLLAVLVIAPLMPPFQNGDEPAHAFRADQISHGRLLAKSLSNGLSGGYIDGGLVQTFGPFIFGPDGAVSLPFHPERKVAREWYEPHPWMPLVANGFAASAIYPPQFYLPAAAGFVLARHAGWSVLAGLTAARIATGIASVAIGAVAIALALDAGVWLFAVLMLPMSLAQAAAVSQDGMMFAVTALAAALLHRAWRGDPGPRRLIWVAALLALVAMARPPYAAFALPLLAVPAPWRWRLACCGAVPALAGLWAVANRGLMRLPDGVGGVVSPGLQLQWLAGHVGAIPALLLATVGKYFDGLKIAFIGVLGWADTVLPQFYQDAAWLVLDLALLSLLLAIDWRRWAGLIVPASVLATVLGIGFIFYLTWSVVGAPTIDGMQGRYFLPCALMLAALPPAVARGPAPLRAMLQWVVVAFPLVTIPVTLSAILWRYYL